MRLILPVSWFSPRSRLARPIMASESYGVPTGAHAENWREVFRELNPRTAFAINWNVRVIAAKLATLRGEGIVLHSA